MRRRDAVLFTRREAETWEPPAMALAVRAGLIRQVSSGLFAWTPTGTRVKSRLECTVARRMDVTGAQRVSLPKLQPRTLWEVADRVSAFGEELFSLENRDGRSYCLAPTHEEAIVDLLRGQLRATRHCPVIVYQIGRTFRDDHPRHGLLRLKEFTMKDAYSLHASASCLDRTFQEIRRTYERLFADLGLSVATVPADNEGMGGSQSAEFVAPVEFGSVPLTSCRRDGCRYGRTPESPDGRPDGDATCPKCGGDLATGEGVELGHIFKLGDRYTAPLELTVTDTEGAATPALMGCYGIGIERVIYAILAQLGCEAGCHWPAVDRGTLAPFRRAIVPLRYEGELARAAETVYDASDPGKTLLFDDPSQSIGERFAESRLLGVPETVIIGNAYLESGQVEIESLEGDSVVRKPLAAFAASNATRRTSPSS